MTVITTKKRKTLSLNRVKPQPELTGLQRGEEHNKRQMEESQRQYLACENWIYSTWPHLFDRNNVKPFAVGIIELIKTEYDKQGGFEAMGFYRNTPFKKVMFGWTKRKAYQRALVKDGAQRYNLDTVPSSRLMKKTNKQRLNV